MLKYTHTIKHSFSYKKTKYIVVCNSISAVIYVNKQVSETD